MEIKSRECCCSIVKTILKRQSFLYKKATKQQYDSKEFFGNETDIKNLLVIIKIEVDNCMKNAKENIKIWLLTI